MKKFTIIRSFYTIEKESVTYNKIRDISLSEEKMYIAYIFTFHSTFYKCRSDKFF